MKITTGLGLLEDYPALAQAGTDEVYCGCVPYEWLKRYGAYWPLNRREVLYYAIQLGSLDEMRILRRMQRDLGVPVALTFNALYYLPEQYPLLIDLMKRLIDLDFSRFIVADPALLIHIRQAHLPCRIHLSGEAGELNEAALRFFEQFPIERYIFHRKLSVSDMSALTHALPGRQFEAFLLNERCHFTGAYCNSLHCDELPHLCKLPYQLMPRRTGDVTADIHAQEDIEDPSQLGSTGCGLCALRRLAHAGVTHLKIVGRGNHADCLTRDIRAVKQALAIAQSAPSEAAFQQALLETLFPQGCDHQCYYR